MSLEQVATQVMPLVMKGFDVNKLLTTEEGRASIAAIVNKAVADMKGEFLTAIEVERKARTAAEEGLKELTERIARREKLDPEFGFHFDQQGRMRPNTSAKCGEYMLALLRASHAKDQTQIRALSGGIDAEGGYLVQPEYAAEILRLVPTVGLARNLFRIVPMTTDEYNFGTLLSSMVVYWPAENAPITKSYPGFGQLKMTNKIMAVLTYASENLLNDATPPMLQFITDLIIEAIAMEEDRVGIAGKVASGDAYDGLLNLSGVVSKVMAAGKTHISDVTAEDILALQTTVPDGARDNGSYLLSPTVMDTGMRTLKDTTGNFIFSRPTDGSPATLWGKPFQVSERLPAYSTAVQVSTPFILYGNFKKWAFLGDRQQVAVKTTDIGGTAFENIQLGIRAHERIGFNGFGAALAKLVTAAS